jgi:serine/threonine-protein kinase
MLVVLPFENLGAPEDEYFAAGMTEEITSRIAAVSGIGVISRTSAVQYDRTGKTLKQIGEDLGVDYVLEGTIRWNKDTAGGSRVRVTPQLIRVSDDTHLWAERYDRVLEDIFAVQSDIAERIIEQLGITMLARERETVEAKPTENLLAYEAYLRGLDQVLRAGSMEDLWRNAVTLFQQAVNLDSTFALAYAKLAEAHGELYFWGYDKTDERLAKCKAAADRSLMLQPDLPEAHMALGGYYYMGFFDYDRALSEYAVAAKSRPNDPDLFEAIAYIWRRQGLYLEAIDYLEKAVVLDPANFWLFMQIGLTHTYMRNYAEAESYLDRSLELNPEQGASYFMKSRNILLWTGDTDQVRTVLETAPMQNHPLIVETSVYLYIFERNYAKALERLEDFPAELVDFATQILPRDLLAGIIYTLMNDPERARASFESARTTLEALVRQRPEEGNARAPLGLAYAGLGRRDDAIREGKKGVELTAHDEIRVTELEWDLVLIYILLEEYDTALDHIERLLSVPSLISVPFLKVFPMMDPLRDHPRFQKILEKYSGDAS